MNRGVRDFAPVEAVGGVVHHRYSLRGVTRYSGFPHDELAERQAALMAPMVRELRPAAVQSATPYLNGLIGHALATAHGLPFVYDVRGFPEMTWATKGGGSGSELYRLRREAETGLMACADAVLTLSGVMRDVIVSRGVDQARVKVVPHVVDTDLMGPCEPDPELLRRYGLEGATVVGYLGSLTEYEGIDLLLRSTAAAAREHPSLRALIVGDGPARPSLEALAERLGISDRVAFAGRVAHHETVAHYSLYDVFVVPRRGWEVCRFVTPLKPFEAMAAGRCLVTSDVPALAEATGWGEWGATFAADDEDALTARILELAADPNERGRLGAAARAAGVHRHGMAAMSSAVRDAFDLVLPDRELMPREAGSTVR